MSELKPTASRLGAMAIFGAKGYFLVASMALGFGLVSALSNEAYAQYFVVNDAVSLVSAVLLGGAIQSVSRHVSADSDRVFDVRRSALSVFGIMGALATLGFAVAAWPVSQLLDDAALLPMFLVAAPIPLCYALYAAHIGVINGRRLFGRQAAFDVGFATVKVGLMLAAAMLGFGAFGVLGGFALTSALVLLAAWPASRAGSPVKPIPGRKLLAFSLATLLYVFAINAVLRADAWLVKRGFEDADAGLYMVSLQIGRVPYQLSVAVALIMFPILAAESEDGESPTATVTIERALRYGFALAALAATTLSGAGRELLYVLAPPKVPAVHLLWVVAPAMLAYTLNYLVCTVLVSRGRPLGAVVVAAWTLVATVVGARLGIESPIHAWVPEAATLPVELVGAAHGVAVANLSGLLVALFVLARGGGVRPSGRMLGIAVVAAAAFAVAPNWEPLGALTGDLGDEAPSRVVALGWGIAKVAAIGAGAGLAMVLTGLLPWRELRGLVLRG